MAAYSVKERLVRLGVLLMKGLAPLRPFGASMLSPKYFLLKWWSGRGSSKLLWSIHADGDMTVTGAPYRCYRREMFSGEGLCEVPRSDMAYERCDESCATPSLTLSNHKPQIRTIRGR